MAIDVEQEIIEANALEEEFKNHPAIWWNGVAGMKPLCPFTIERGIS